MTPEMVDHLIMAAKAKKLCELEEIKHVNCVDNLGENLPECLDRCAACCSDLLIYQL